MKSFLPIVLDLFLVIACCTVLAHLWGPSVIHYSSSLWQQFGSMLKPFGFIIGAVFCGFFLLQSMRF